MNEKQKIIVGGDTFSIKRLTYYTDYCSNSSMYFLNIYPITKPKGAPKIIPTMVQINFLFFIDFLFLAKILKGNVCRKDNT